MKNILCFENPLFLKTFFLKELISLKTFLKRNIFENFIFYFLCFNPPPLKKTDFFFVLKKQFSKKATKNSFFFFFFKKIKETV